MVTLLGSKSTDGTVCLWSTDTWECVSVLYEYCVKWLASISFHPTLPALATLGKEEKAIRIWDLDIDAILSNHSSNSPSYTNAKVVLLGDSGVGKSGLGLVLSNQPFASPNLRTLVTSGTSINRKLSLTADAKKIVKHSCGILQASQGIA